jgi:hypothetical protein
MTRKLLALPFLALAAMGCSSTRIGDFTALSTKNVYAKNVDITKLPKKEGVEGEDVRFLGIGANFKDAVDKALEAGGGNVMIDAAFYMESRPFASGYRVRGTVINVPYTATAAK